VSSVLAYRASFVVRVNMAYEQEYAVRAEAARRDAKESRKRERSKAEAALQAAVDVEARVKADLDELDAEGLHDARVLVDLLGDTENGRPTGHKERLAIARRKTEYVYGTPFWEDFLRWQNGERLLHSTDAEQHDVTDLERVLLNKKQRAKLRKTGRRRAREVARETAQCKARLEEAVLAAAADSP
jgi:hypothetical protein